MKPRRVSLESQENVNLRYRVCLKELKNEGLKKVSDTHLQAKGSRGGGGENPQIKILSEKRPERNLERKSWSKSQKHRDLFVRLRTRTNGGGKKMGGRGTALRLEEILEGDVKVGSLSMKWFSPDGSGGKLQSQRYLEECLP